MTIWFTADSHFSHGNIINYCGRPFETKQEHDETLIKNWNSVVKPGDTVYHLGDFGFGDEEYLAKIGSRLRGKIGLILGNHDKRVHKEPLRSRFMFVKDVHMISSHGMRIFLSHYAHRTWFMSNQGSIMLHGHSHGNMEPYGLSCDVGVDCWNFTPVNILTIKELMEKRKLELDYNPKEPKGKWSGIEALKA